MELIKTGKQKLCLKFGLNDISVDLSFFSEHEDFLQVGGRSYKKGTEILAHSHNPVTREIDRTQEFLYVVSGSLKSFIYDDKDKIFKTLVLNSNEGLILFSGGHGFEVLEDNTKIIEVKNGPYMGPDADRRRLSL